MKKIISFVVMGVITVFIAHPAMGQQYILDGGYQVSAYWNQKSVTRTDYSHVTAPPQAIGYTVFLDLGCRLTRMSDGQSSGIIYPNLGISGNCDLVNDNECNPDIAMQRAHSYWSNVADFFCWTDINRNWDPDFAERMFF